MAIIGDFLLRPGSGSLNGLLSCSCLGFWRIGYMFRLQFRPRTDFWTSIYHAIRTLFFRFNLLWLIISLFTMILCINCNIADHGNHYNAMDMSPEIVSLIEEWTAHEATDGDKICQECFNLLIVELNNRNEGNIGERQFGHQFVCVCCGISLSRQTGRRSRPLHSGTAEHAYIANLVSPRQIPAVTSLCNICWQRAYHYGRLHREPEFVQIELPAPGNVQIPLLASESGSSSVAEPSSEPSSDFPGIDNEPRPQEVARILLQGYSRTPDTSSHCFVPECVNVERRRVPLYLRKKILTDCRLFITSNARVCDTHLEVYDFDFLNDYEFMSDFTSSLIVEMLDVLRKPSQEGVVNFERIESANEKICKYWTGLTVTQFLLIMGCLTQLGGMCRRPKTALGLYLVRIRTGEPLRRIASLFCISTTLLCTYIKKARQCLTAQYVPSHIGLNHITREDVSNRNLLIPQGLFGTESNNPIVLLDGTYVYLQRSSNYLFQKKTYSLHKFRNLVKPFLIVASDGYILDIYGPYAATTSDADIVKLLFQNDQTPQRQFFRPNDVFILDRGFRDAIGLLTSLHYNVFKPETRGEGETQLSTIKANRSRMVTLCRWVIEVVNGRFKRDFKIFRTKYFNLAVTHLMDDFKIAGAIINHFHPAVIDRSDAQAILNRAQERLNMTNYLAEHVIMHHLNRRRANFVQINAELPQLNMFPTMEMSDLILFSLGTYQIKQARSYYGEHIRANGTFVVEVCDNINIVTVPGVESSHETFLIRGKIWSRHQTSRVYYNYILIKNNDADWQDRICGYYCSCIIGKRTLGSCAHVMTLIWYLGWARHQNNIAPPAQFLDHVLVREDIEIEEDE